MSTEGLGKATMYVITEKGLEVGPFVYNKDTDSRVFCPNKRRFYNNHHTRDNAIVGSVKLNLRKDGPRKLKVVDLSADSLHTEGLSNDFISRHVRDLENWGLRSGNFRNRKGLKSGKMRLNTAASSSHDSSLKEDDDLDIVAIKRLLQSKKELDYMAKKIASPKKDMEMSLSGKRQLILRRLRIKRQSEVLLEEIARLRDKSNTQFDEQKKELGERRESFLRNNKNARWLKHIIYPFGDPRSLKDDDRNDGTVHVHLPSLDPSKGASSKGNNKEKQESKNLQNIPPKINKKDSKEKLVFLSPRVQYNQSEAESSAKMNINEGKVNNSKPKVRLPAVIDQRTGEMHTVPGVVAFRQSDYNQWSRRENIIRREVVPTRSPSLTYVSFLPSVTGDNKL